MKLSDAGEPDNNYPVLSAIAGQSSVSSIRPLWNRYYPAWCSKQNGKESRTLEKETELIDQGSLELRDFRCNTNDVIQFAYSSKEASISGRQ
jgi:hypothetical protein